MKKRPIWVQLWETVALGVIGTSQEYLALVFIKRISISADKSANFV